MCRTLAACPGRTSGAMDVLNGVARKVVLDDKRQVRKVQSPRCDARADKAVKNPFPHKLRSFQTMFDGSFTMHGFASDSAVMLPS